MYLSVVLLKIEIFWVVIKAVIIGKFFPNLWRSFRIKKFEFESEEATALRNVGKC
jgi:hypothetical protein